MATTQQQALTTLGTEPITTEQLLEMDAKGMRGELIRGVFCPTMPVNEEHAQIVMKLGWLLGNVINPGKLGRILGSDGGVLIETDPPTVREPDIAFISSDRRPPGTVVRNYTEIPPDLVVEVVSPSDSVRGINDKASMWINAGVRLVWVLWPETKDDRSPPPRPARHHPPRNRHPNRRRNPPPIQSPHQRHLRRLDPPSTMEPSNPRLGSKSWQQLNNRR